MFSLENRVALVTGGEHGIGKGIAGVLHKAGAKIVIGGIDEAAGQQVAKELGGLFLKLDVTRQSDCQSAIAEIEKQFGQLDILCSNAGIFPQANWGSCAVPPWKWPIAASLSMR
ncbi:MAG: SDR family NAD(P)-dependent oxidoreductase [Marinobacter sp.]|uniref:SDR family NAD(P)-dependent oxidoreductase n=1 Tax=Marinobacter sp. TaxID=50741 RepID=UPI0029C32294|nr:SDR family NAD(P)-dependent oxidoreductase [Marinobacter sp.]MDX5334617.1 SDR family NAD(P)-dependent oxidoreductase [Marinobacter sp.]MDX5385113.1 SDR family NAD(P)-dependent oxidoreductase [Marinobacter sp.]MDX5470818.1 SDR family NAD(P)-dependent oxidoreductase [Marinobacter sp.]